MGFRFACFWSVVCLGGFSGLWGQTSCPAIDFFSAPQFGPPSAQTALVLQRQPDGTYSSIVAAAVPPFGILSQTPNFGSQLAGCTIPPRPGSGGPATPPTTTGTASQQAVAAPFGGPGTIGVAFFTNPQGTSIMVAVGTTAGTLLSANMYTVGNSSFSLLAADFNGDGFPDLAVADSAFDFTTPGTVAVLMNKGDGTFQAPVNYTVGVNPARLTAADFNGDGKLDLAVTNDGSGVGGGSVSILLGNGNGTFRAAANINLSDIPVAVAAADLNHDGKIDLAVVGLAAVTILLGNGSGSFQSGATYPISSVGEYIAIADFNHDGTPDLATSNAANTVSVLIGKGDGTFRPPVDYVLGLQPPALVVADLNADGNLDIVGTNGTPDYMSSGVSDSTVLFGNGDGTFQAPSPYPAGQMPWAIAAGDLNGDGKQDFVVASQYNGVSVYLGDGQGHFTAAPAVSGSLMVAIGDFNGDKKPDLAVGNSNSQGGGVSILPGNGDGTFQAPLSFLAGTSANALAAADFNGDGKLDLAVVNPGALGSTSPGVVSILQGNGNGSLQVPVNYTVGVQPNGIVAADFNGDGKTDLAVVNSGQYQGDPGGVSILLNKGNGTFQNAVSYSAGTNPTFVAAGDLNGDGKPDLVVTTNGPNFGFLLAVLLGNGDGTFKPASLISTDFGPSSVVIKDFNGDGKPDLIVAHCCGATDMTFLVGNGDGTFQPEVHFAGGASPWALAVADFNGDGMPDLAIADQGSQGTTGYATVLLNTTPNPILNNSFFVNQLYLDLLGRPADTAGLNYWLGQLTSGATTRAQLADSFFTSPEFESNGLFIISAYIAVLGRNADYTGWLYWLGNLQAGLAPQQVINAFIQSTEFQTTYGTLNNTAFVTLVYQNVLARAPDASGLSYWTGQLNSGAATRAQVMYSFATSAEFQSRIQNQALATLLYLGFLRRSPDPGGVTYWTGQLNAGITPATVLTAFITSAEYLARF